MTHDPSGMDRLPVGDSFDAALARLESALSAKGLTVFAWIDFTADARAAGLTMPPTRLTIFGSAKAGTPLMLAAPTIALDLPLKLLLWTEPDGLVYVGWNSGEYLAEHHGLPQAGQGPLAAVAAIAAVVAGG